VVLLVDLGKRGESRLRIKGMVGGGLPDPTKKTHFHHGLRGKDWHLEETHHIIVVGAGEDVLSDGKKKLH